MEAATRPVVRALPASLRNFLRESCRLAETAFVPVRPARLPEPEKRLLDHAQDMTSTLAEFHECALAVDVLQQRIASGHYLREVFLRTIPGGRIAEYGVIAIVLEQFSNSQQEDILAARVPLGNLLKRDRILFVSSPIAFFSISAADVPRAPALNSSGQICHGRFNRLGTPAGDPLAWILEILPPGPGSSRRGTTVTKSGNRKREGS